MRFAVVTPDPAAWMHVRAFDEAAEAVQQGLVALGHSCGRLVGRLEAGDVSIVFGAHHLDEGASLPAGTVLFNLEQVVPGSLWLSPQYVALLRRHRVWDYSLRNIEALRALGVTNVTHVPLGHAASLERIRPQAEDIDVLFYGRLIERRTRLLDEVASRGLRVVALNDAYGEKRDAAVARAKIVLNVHAGEQSRLETARCFYALINGRFVLSEDSVDAGESGLAAGMALAPYGELAERCAWFVEHPAERAVIAQAGRALMRARPQAEFLRPALAALQA